MYNINFDILYMENGNNVKTYNDMVQIEKIIWSQIPNSDKIIDFPSHVFSMVLVALENNMRVLKSSEMHLSSYINQILKGKIQNRNNQIMLMNDKFERLVLNNQNEIDILQAKLDKKDEELHKIEYEVKQKEK